MTPFTTALLLLFGGFAAALVLAAQRRRLRRTARCPHCCVRKHYYVGYANKGQTDTEEPTSVRCKSCQLLFMVPG